MTIRRENIDIARARGEVLNAKRELRQLNDQVADANTRLKVARAAVRRAETQERSE